jgi:neurocan core protein
LQEPFCSSGSLYVVEGLKPQTGYEFRFAAKNEVGLGNWGSYFREVMPNRAAPGNPRILTTPNAEYESSTFNNQYELSWVTPPDNGEPIDKYVIKYCQMNRFLDDWQVLETTCDTDIVKSQRTKHYLKKLNPDTFYKVELQAHNAIGYSKPGFAKFKTARGKSLPTQFSSLGVPLYDPA